MLKSHANYLLHTYQQIMGCRKGVMFISTDLWLVLSHASTYECIQGGLKTAVAFTKTEKWQNNNNNNKEEKVPNALK